MSISRSASAAASSRTPSLFASAAHRGDVCDFPILDELSVTRREVAGERWAISLLVFGVLLAAVGGGVIALGSGMNRSSAQFDGVVDVLVGEAPVTRTPQEPMVRAEEVPMRAATIVEVPASAMEMPKFAGPVYDRSDSAGGKVRPGDARPEKANAAAGHERSVVVRGTEREKGKSGVGSTAVKSAPASMRRLPPHAKHVERSVDADAQVIEAIVMRSR